jgi:hypothetical protein
VKLLRLKEEIKVFRIPLEETLEYKTVGEAVDTYMQSLAEVGFHMLRWESILEDGEVEVVFRKVH